MYQKIFFFVSSVQKPTIASGARGSALPAVRKKFRIISNKEVFWQHIRIDASNCKEVFRGHLVCNRNHNGNKNRNGFESESEWPRIGIGMAKSFKAFGS